MKKLIVTALLGFTALKGWQWYSSPNLVEPLTNEPYIAVYGRDSCGYTQRTLENLEKQGLSYQYFKIDKRTVADQLHSRMESANISTRRYNLPVVDVNGHIVIRPKTESIVENHYQ